MSMKPWREIAIPHDDVAKGSFSESEFAADLTKVRAGNAPQEYQNPSVFFERTYLTEGMRLLLDSVLRRLSGRGGDPVVQLKTAFGGGKTHSMLTVYHLAQGGKEAANWSGIAPLLTAANLESAPTARVVVLDGNALAPAQPAKRGEILVHTLWGELAWQLGGSEGYEMVAQSDKQATSPGKEILTALLSKYAPAVILMDESVAYLRQLVNRKDLPAGTFEANMSFIQALTEALTSTPKTLLLASLPESDTEMAGKDGHSALQALEKYFKRVESIWKPVAAQESFSIVRKRLFQPIRDLSQRNQVCDAAFAYYGQNATLFPVETQKSDYLDRLKEAYPIHPEVFDRLYEDWSTLEKFQRTRGVLQMMALGIHYLWKTGNTDSFIMPGGLHLGDSAFANKAMSYLDNGWDAVIDKDIDGKQSDSAEVDSKETRFGSLQAARRLARAIFFGTAPGHNHQGKGVGQDEKHVLLGAVQPEQNPAVYKDALKAIENRLHYLNAADGRYWFNIRPNLLREMETRKGKILDADVVAEIKTRIENLLQINSSAFSARHIFVEGAEIPDDPTLRLVVLKPSEAYSSSNTTNCHNAAQKIIDFKGSTPRKNRNRLVFIAAESSSVSILRNQVQTLLAWDSILRDADDKLNLDNNQKKTAKSNRESTNNQVDRTARDCYRWMIVPSQKLVNGIPSAFGWDNYPLDTNCSTMAESIKARCQNDELVIPRISPKILNPILSELYWNKGQTTIKLKALWEALCCYLYFPRLQSSDTLFECITDGVSAQTYFGYAHDESLAGFAFGGHCSPVADEYAVLVSLVASQAEAARIEAERNRPVPPTPSGNGSAGGNGNGGAAIPQPPIGGSTVVVTPPTNKKTRAWGSIDLSGNWKTSGVAYNKILDDIIRSLAMKPGSEVTIKLDIEVQAGSGQQFDENIQRAIRDNAKGLGFEGAIEFEEG